AHCAAIPANGVPFCAPVGVADESDITSGNVMVVRGRPNPFRNAVSFSFKLPASGPVSVDIYSADGRLVQNVAHQDMAAGNHVLTWNLAKDVPNGIYFYRVSSSVGQATGKITRMN